MDISKKILKKQEEVKIIKKGKKITQIIAVNEKGEILYIVELESGKIYIAKNYERKSVLDNIDNFLIDNVKPNLDIVNINDIEKHPDIEKLKQEAVDGLKELNEKNFAERLRDRQQQNSTTDLNKTR